MRGQQGVTHRHRNEVGLCQAGSFKLHKRSRCFLAWKTATLQRSPLCRMVCQVCCVIFDRNLPLAQCSWSSASHSVERKWRTAKNTCDLLRFLCRLSPLVGRPLQRNAEMDRSPQPQVWWFWIEVQWSSWLQVQHVLRFNDPDFPAAKTSLFASLIT